MRRVIQRGQGGLVVSAVRNNHRLRLGEAFLPDGLGEGLGADKVPLSARVPADDEAYARLSPHAPDVGAARRAVEDAVADLVERIERAIAEEAARLRKSGVKQVRFRRQVRRSVIERLSQRGA